jgi:hypothetical protein
MGEASSADASDSRPKCESSRKLIDTTPTEAVDTSNQNPAMWGTVGHSFPDDFLDPVSPDEGRVAARSSMPDIYAGSTDRVLLPTGPRRSSQKFDVAQGVLDEDAVMNEISETECFGDKDAEDECDTRRHDVGETRDIAARVLAAITEKDETPQPPSTPSHQSAEREPTSEPHPRSSKSTPSPRFLRSPCWGTLVSVTPPPSGYWTPSSTGEGEKNTPMCPPCRTGKKGRCFGALPCDRCRDKGYSKERCEGSLAFRFSPKTRRGCGDKEKVRKSPADGGRWKRDAFGRFA